MSDGYDFGASDLTTLLIRRFYPEKTDRESTVIHDFIAAHGTEYDRYQFSVRVGRGMTPDPSHLPGVQAQSVRNTQKRIDMVFWQGATPTIIEAKERVGTGVLGQILANRLLWMEQNPDAPEPRLLIIGRYSDDDTLRSIGAHGITVLLYEREATT